MKNVKKILDILTSQERRQAVFLFCMVLLMALIDTLGVASILPFMAVLADPSLIESNVWLHRVYIGFNFSDPEAFLLTLGGFVLMILVISLAFKALTTYIQLRFTHMREFSIGKRLLESYLSQPYEWFLKRHSADLGKNILSEVNIVVTGALIPIVTLIAQAAVTLALLTLLLLVDYQLAITVTTAFATSYVLIFFLSKSLLERIGKERVVANQKRFTAISNAFGAIKEVKVGGLENFYTNCFYKPAYIYAKHQASAKVINQLPRFALEAIAFGGVLLVMLYFLNSGDEFATALPIMSLYAFAGYRLMPALQQIYISLTQLKFVGPSLDLLHKDFLSLQARGLPSDIEKITLKSAIELKNLTYSYPDSTPSLKEINITIYTNSVVGVVGPTGAGKTTLVDLLLGLHEAQIGSLAVDGEVITHANHRGWQKSIGYVPQQIYLTDDTVSANIAFGINQNDIDQQAVERAARIAQLHDFIVNDLPEGYSTILGERGSRFSGGQRQRIGIARALYKNPSILIMDEATSALDNITEQAVMASLNKIVLNTTVIIIAHRLRVLKNCDHIFYIENGSVKAQGDFDYLNLHEEGFRKQVALQ